MRRFCCSSGQNGFAVIMYAHSVLHVVISLKTNIIYILFHRLKVEQNDECPQHDSPNTMLQCGNSVFRVNKQVQESKKFKVSPDLPPVRCVPCMTRDRLP
ncbi:hypothetical protein CHARACLAT_023184 [Characodon lateralis]|uniref:Uncharacterized protein n=1 Tax=Characodon lateralis TaxID=208331 RepID=A0ABU7E3I6_9TELE|nr:hypothetical protein [Characodon lateralis]